MDRLQRLESQAIYVLREAYRSFPSLCMLWSIGKDSTVLLHLARKAFFGHVPFPLVHIDTGFKIPEMIAYRDRLVREWHLDMIVGQNREALRERRTYPDGACSRIECCRLLKSEALKHTIAGDWPRWRFDHEKGRYEEDANPAPFTGVIVGVRADEEGTRSKERVFSPRSAEGSWNIGDQPPELWNYYNTDFAPGTHVRIHPILECTELDIWEYIRRERIPVVSLYFDRGEGRRYRSPGCAPCTSPILSRARTVDEIVEELSSGALKGVAERSGREQDKEDGGTLETLRREGYM
ncbi:phosphoadenosine phosphosulfate reductase [Spirochaeta thermophila DSM 6578]|uniref:Sulfate adenylyltransferase subunit 2 n=1 Tax=Winmispira thermophila (strain ATCC 700085 / DSM 6578 / Z-1203) TaxID=869211 RepID=G0GBC9_WINT7|nr:sulfate adenylyltransferase subunit CysD [Spirochaeta thermophila]AEJ61938.1 phosphoadenosine phosphosulfate reductase [Spirochaeta thermophila DSM 6578]